MSKGKKCCRKNQDEYGCFYNMSSRDETTCHTDCHTDFWKTHHAREATKRTKAQGVGMCSRNLDTPGRPVY